MERTEPISTIHLFPILDQKLLQLLRSLSENDWDKPTMARKWRVKDIAAHLLDGNIRGISIIRDNYFGEKPENVNSYRNLVAFLNDLNADWVKAMRRTSPNLLISLLETSGMEYFKALAALEPFDRAIFSVAWAGEEESQNWFHIAREYTEKWHHQQQIRNAVGAEEELYKPDLLRPFLETCLRALPYHYRNFIRPTGFILEFRIHHNNVNYQWRMVKDSESWAFMSGSNTKLDCIVTLPASIAWKLFTNGLKAEEAEELILVEGDKEMGMHLLSMHTVMV